MKPQIRHEVVRAVLPSLVGVVLMAVLWWSHDYAYDSLCPGVPDHGQVRIGTVPRLFWAYRSGPLNIADKELFITWGLACAFFLLPSLVAFMVSRGMAANAFSLALLLGLITHGCWCHIGYVTAGIEIFVPPLTYSKVILRAWPGVAWIFALSLGGAVIGIVAPRIARAVWPRAVVARRGGGID